MSYEIYKTIKDKDDYFATWDTTQVESLNDELKNEIYNKYLVKASMLQRDSFVCQNTGCRTFSSDLTMHHVKFKKNGGMDSVRNVVTLCHDCHSNFHRHRGDIILNDGAHLPSHMRGMTFRMHRNNDINWIEIRRETKKIRKANRDVWGTRISWETVALLMRILNKPYNLWDD